MDICSSRQAALGTILRTLSDPEAGNGAAPGDEIILAPITWPWVMRGVSDCGFTPVLADISSESSNLDTGSVRKALSPRTKAVLVSHNGNSCADLDSLSALCAEKGLRLIDCGCLSSLGGLYDRRFIGAKSDMGLLFPMSPQSRWGLIFSNIAQAQGAFNRLLSGRPAPEGADLFLPARAESTALSVAARVASRMKEKERQLRDTEPFAAYTGFFKAYGDFFIIPKPPQKARLAGRFFIVIVRPGAPFGVKDLPGPALLGEARRAAMGGYGRYSPMPEVDFRQEGDLQQVREIVERGVMYAVIPGSRDREEFFDTFSSWMKKWKKTT
jgi:hypothetical protein